MALKFDAPIYIDEKVVQKSAELSKNHPPRNSPTETPKIAPRRLHQLCSMKKITTLLLLLLFSAQIIG